MPFPEWRQGTLAETFVCGDELSPTGLLPLMRLRGSSRKIHTKIDFMDGIFLPVTGLFVSLCVGLISFVIPRLRRFTLAALTAPFLTSVVLLIGGFILADMNPAREYGAAYIPNGREHDPTKLDYALLFISVVSTFVMSGYVAFLAQKYATRATGALIGRREIP